MDSRSWHQQTGNSGGQSSRTTYTSSSSSYNNGHSTSSYSHNNGHSISSFEGFPSFDTLSQPSFTSLTREENHSASGFDSKLKSLEDRGNTIAQKDQDRSAEWDEKMKEVQDRQEALVQEEKDRAAIYEQKLKDLQAREDEVAKREEQDGSSKAAADSNNNKEFDKEASNAQAKREAEIQRKLDDLKLTEQKVAADRAALDKSRTDLAAERKEFQQRVKEFEDAKLSAENDALQAKKNLEQRQREFENQTSSALKKNSTPATRQPDANTVDGTSEAELQRKQRENAKLEQRLARLEKQLSQMSAASIISDGTSKGNGTAKGRIFSNGSGAMGCGYKHYKPPRKLERKLIGMIYE
jgi:chromosome segregation ATPase